MKTAFVAPRILRVAARWRAGRMSGAFLIPMAALAFLRRRRPAALVSAAGRRGTAPGGMSDSPNMRAVLVRYRRDGVALEASGRDRPSPSPYGGSTSAAMSAGRAGSIVLRFVERQDFFGKFAAPRVERAFVPRDVRLTREAAARRLSGREDPRPQRRPDRNPSNALAASIAVGSRSPASLHTQSAVRGTLSLSNRWAALRLRTALDHGSLARASHARATPWTPGTGVEPAPRFAAHEAHRLNWPTAQSFRRRNVLLLRSPERVPVETSVAPGSQRTLPGRSETRIAGRPVGIVRRTSSPAGVRAAEAPAGTIDRHARQATARTPRAEDSRSLMTGLPPLELRHPSHGASRPGHLTDAHARLEPRTAPAQVESPVASPRASAASEMPSGPVLDRVADEIIRRIEKRQRIERERRGH